MKKQWVLKHFKTDPQREALYKVEHAFTPKFYWRGGMTNAQIKRLIARVRRQYNLRPITLKMLNYKSDDGGYCEPEFTDGELRRAILALNRHKNPICVRVVLHELAHVICDQYYGEDVQPHGREFVGIVIWLYNTYDIVPEDAFRMVLRRYKVRHKSMPESSPSALKAMKKCRG